MGQIGQTKTVGFVSSFVMMNWFDEINKLIISLFELTERAIIRIVIILNYVSIIRFDHIVLANQIIRLF